MINNKTCGKQGPENIERCSNDPRFQDLDGTEKSVVNYNVFVSNAFQRHRTFINYLVSSVALKRSKLNLLVIFPDTSPLNPFLNFNFPILFALKATKSIP